MGQRDISGRWFTRRDGVVRGPFSADNVTRYILLGRIRLDDEVSEDRVLWQPAKTLTSLLPDEITHLSSWEDYQRFIVARMQVDDRKNARRGPETHTSATERRSGTDRRKEDSALMLARYVFGECDPISPQKQRSRYLRTLLLTLLLAALMLAWLVPAGR